MVIRPGFLGRGNCLFTNGSSERMQQLNLQEQGAEEPIRHLPKHNDIKNILNLKIYFSVQYVSLDHRKADL